MAADLEKLAGRVERMPDHRKPENMSSDTIIGVRIGLVLAVELIDHERVKVLADGTYSPGKTRKRARELGNVLDDLGTRIFAIRDQYDPAAALRARGRRG